MAEDLARLPPARRISFQPVMALGLTGTELIVVIGAGFGCLAAVMLVTIPLFGALHVSLLSGALAGLAGALVLRVRITGTSRQAPEGYVLQRLHGLRLQFGSLPDLIAGHGSWDAWRHGRDG